MPSSRPSKGHRERLKTTKAEKPARHYLDGLFAFLLGSQAVLVAIGRIRHGPGIVA